LPMVRMVSLAEPVTFGPVDTTLTRYPEPLGIVAGMVTKRGLIVPVGAKFVGFVKSPVALESCAVKTGLLKVPFVVNGTVSVEPAQISDSKIPVVMVRFWAREGKLPINAPKSMTNQSVELLRFIYT
jgi:hypothetical protein